MITITYSTKGSYIHTEKQSHHKQQKQTIIKTLSLLKTEYYKLTLFLRLKELNLQLQEER